MMVTKFDPAKKYILDLPRRRAFLDPERILSAVGLQEGDCFGDLGCGTGHFSLPAATIVGDRGIVFTVDIQPHMLLSVAAKVTRQGLTNVKLVLSAENSVPLPDGLFDQALMANLLPELEDHQAFCIEAARMLKPSGRLAVIDWHKREMTEGPCQQIRISQEEAIALCTHGPLALVSEFAAGPYHYGFILKRR